MEGGEGRPAVPVIRQQGERSGAGQPSTLDRPINLVGNIRSLVERERAKGNPYFNPAWFLRNEMKSQFMISTSRSVPEYEKAEFFTDLRIAWELVAYSELEDHRDAIYGDIQTFGDDKPSITLQPSGVMLLGAMAEALNIPNYTSGQVTFDISLFSLQEMMPRVRKGLVPEGHIYPVPSIEEVKQSLKPKNSK